MELILVCCMPSKQVTKSETGHIDGQFWIWPDGKRTHIRFLQEAVITKRPLPPGFYKEAKKSKSQAIKHMASVAKNRGVKEAE